MRVLISHVYHGDVPTIADRKIISNIGDSLKYHGVDVDFVAWGHFDDLSQYDVCIWDHCSIVFKATELDGYNDCINLVYAHASFSLNLDLDIDGVIYSARQHYLEDSGHTFKFLWPNATKLLYEPVEEFGEYIFLSGQIVSSRCLHVDILSDILSKSKLPIKIVKYPMFGGSNDVDPDMYRRVYEFYKYLALDKGILVEEYGSMPSGDFQDMLRHAAMYVFARDFSPGSVITQEAMLYGVPLITVDLNRIGFTAIDNYFHVPINTDFNMANNIASKIDYICENSSEIKAKSLKWAAENQHHFSYEYAGKELLNFIRQIGNSK